MDDIRILVVDDHAPVRYLFRRSLESAGYLASEAGDGQEALEALEKERYDLVITDWDMPRMNGEQLLAELHESQPVLIVSSNRGVPRRYRSLSKPVRPRQLVKAVKDLLESP